MEAQQVTPTTPPVVLPPVEKPAGSNRNFKILLLVFLFLLLGVVVTYAVQNYQPQPQSDLLPKPQAVVTLTPTPEETKEKETYSNPVYAFGFTYPGSYTLNDTYLKALPEEPLVFGGDTTKNYCDTKFDSLWIYQQQFDDTATREEIEFPTIKLQIVNTRKNIDTIINECSQNEKQAWDRDKNFGNPMELGVPADFSGPQVLSKESVQGNGLKATKVDRIHVPYNKYYGEVMYYFKKDDYLYLLTATYDPLDPQNNLYTERFDLDQVFSSFIFLQ